jgi:hypothetical protein
MAGEMGRKDGNGFNIALEAFNTATERSEKADVSFGLRDFATRFAPQPLAGLCMVAIQLTSKRRSLV